MTSLDTTVTRDGNWWVAEFTLHGKEYGTQARRLDQIEAMVKDAAALITGESLDSFTVNITVETSELAEYEGYRTKCVGYGLVGWVPFSPVV